MNTIIFSDTAAEIIRRLTCNVDECLVWLASIFNLFTLFVLAVVSFAKPNKLLKLVSLVWCGIEFCAAVLVVFLHACILTILSTVFTGFLIVGIISLAINMEDNSGSYSQVPERNNNSSNNSICDSFTSLKLFQTKGMYVVFPTKNGLGFALQKNAKTVLAKSTFVYPTLEYAKKGIAVSRENGLIADLQDLTASLIRDCRCPKFETYQEGDGFFFRFAIDETYVILKSEKYIKVEECLKAMKLASLIINSNDIYYSKDIDSSYDDAILDPRIVEGEKSSIFTDVMTKISSSNENIVNYSEKEEVKVAKKAEPKKPAIEVAPVVQAPVEPRTSSLFTEEDFQEDDGNGNLWLNEDGTPKIDNDYPAFFKKMLKELSNERRQEFLDVVSYGGTHSSIRRPMKEFYKDEAHFLIHFFSSTAFRSKIAVETYEQLHDKFRSYLTTDFEHLMLDTKMINIYYLHRNDSQEMIEKAKEYCIKDIDHQLNKMKKTNFRLASIKKLITILTAEKNYDEAIKYCDLAISKGLIDFKDEGFEERRKELEGKKAWAIRQAEKALQPKTRKRRSSKSTK